MKMDSISTILPDSVLEVSMPNATEGSQHRALSIPGDSRLPTSRLTASVTVTFCR